MHMKRVHSKLNHLSVSIVVECRRSSAIELQGQVGRFSRAKFSLCRPVERFI